MEYLSSRHVDGGCPDLQHLSLRQGFGNRYDMSHDESPANITDAGINHLSQGCSRLQTLDLGRCKLVTDEGLHSLSQGCQLLQHLDLEHCDITDKGLSNLAQNCRLLKYFNCSILYMVPPPHWGIHHRQRYWRAVFRLYFLGVLERFRPHQTYQKKYWCNSRFFQLYYASSFEYYGLRIRWRRYSWADSKDGKGSMEKKNYRATIYSP